MLITVLCGSNRSLTLNVSRTIPLSEFKAQVSRETGISVDNIRLIYNGRLLTNDNDFWTCDLQHGSKLHLLDRSILQPPQQQQHQTKKEEDETSAAAAAAATATTVSGQGEDVLTEDGIALAVERAEAPALKRAALAATVDAGTGAAVFAVADAARDLATVEKNIPFVCEWRFAAVWRLPAGATAAAVRVGPLPAALLDADAVARMTLLRMQDDVLELVDGVAARADGAVLVLGVARGADVAAGGYYAVACRARGLSCVVCGRDDGDDTMMICGGCQKLCHCGCLDPPLAAVPAGDWLCDECAAARAAEAGAADAAEATAARRKAATPGARATRRWGGGVSCVGRTSECVVVGKNHFGAIPGVPVGKHWTWRYQCSESGVHRVLVGGIHARGGEGCFSICLSGGYEDDVDNGDEVLYTGSGGKDLSGNRRTGAPTSDQTLTRNNLAMTLNTVCHRNGCPHCTPTRGCDACRARWREGKPIRVCRSFKLRSEYAPAHGIRYDGLYKLVDYWPEKGRSGFLVYRYLLRRDDPAPAPWTPAGAAFIRDNHLDDLPDDVPSRPPPKRPSSSSSSSQQPLPLTSISASISASDTDDGDTVTCQPPPPLAGVSDTSGTPPVKRRRGRPPKKLKEADKHCNNNKNSNNKEDDGNKTAAAAAVAAAVATTTGEVSGPVDQKWKCEGREFIEMLQAQENEKTLVDEVLMTMEHADTEEHFLAATKNLLQCPICMDDCLRPTFVLACGHHVCQGCMKRVMVVGNAQCPMCRAAVPATFLATEKTNSLYAALAKHFLRYVVRDL